VHDCLSLILVALMLPFKKIDATEYQPITSDLNSTAGIDIAEECDETDTNNINEAVCHDSTNVLHESDLHDSETLDHSSSVSWSNQYIYYKLLYSTLLPDNSLDIIGGIRIVENASVVKLLKLICLTFLGIASMYRFVRWMVRYFFIENIEYPFVSLMNNDLQQISLEFGRF
jgi:hypothetical protein